ncbi:hypothetical protein GYMLUDRAFT_45924 [Collybiopsis luxurians FD-317 M1]|uniref:Uncharacterized protein n=1 Tax=Collybiopsis luxurians FD-317 M1 TaxID=944289 RepID=A0A0D0C5G6_9AGAR|nr:hypothetical protein GYMLUDRAFT_45924 [Collybiopsis luxurians FD-317 M1]
MSTGGGAVTQRYLQILEKLQLLEEIAGYIEAKVKLPTMLMLYQDSVKELSNGVKVVLNIVLYEHNTAPEQLKEEMLDQLEDRLQEFLLTTETCKRVVDVLQGRNKFMAKVLRVTDLRRIKELQAEVKTRGIDLERRITRLKINWPEHGHFTRAKGSSEVSDDQHEQWPSSGNTNTPSSVVPRSTRTSNTSAVTSTTTLANASIEGGQFNTVGHDMYRNTVYDYSQHTIIHNHFHT